MKIKTALAIVFAALTVFLTGCFSSEKFDAVVTINAHSKPGMFDKSYSWHIKEPQEAPLMVFRLK
ncbi:MAG: hypothetical protein ACK4F6_10025 [Hylemonella sp.]